MADSKENYQLDLGSEKVSEKVPTEGWEGSKGNIPVVLILVS